MKTGTLILMVLISLSIKTFAQEKDALFFYIPDNESMSYYLNFHSYLIKLDRNETDIDDQTFLAFLDNYIGKNSLQSLLFESFLRHTKNTNIQSKVLKYFIEKNINTNFTNGLMKLYASKPESARQLDGKETLRYNYNNSEFDENINLFNFSEVGLFNREIGMLLFENNWMQTSLNSNDENIEAFFLLEGGETNALSISFKRYSNISESEVESIYNAAAYRQRYKENW